MMIKEKKTLSMRHELKHVINSADDAELQHRLTKLFPHDKYAGADGTYLVNSLYFDTPYDKALRQKIDGVNCREKFRIRFYNEDTSFIRLEKKIKINGLCGKYSTGISKEQVQRILEGEIGFLLEDGNPLFLELYSKMQGQLLRPKTVVLYEREAFSYAPGNVRITIDRKLRTGLGSTEFLKRNSCLVDVSEKQAILEVKYDAFLPEIVQMAVQLQGRKSEAFSKYAVCRKYD